MAIPTLSEGPLRTEMHYAYDMNPYSWNGGSSKFFAGTAYNLSTTPAADSILKITNLNVSINPPMTAQGYIDHGGYAKITIGLFANQNSTTPVFHLVKDLPVYPGQNIVLVDREDSIYLTEGQILKGYMILADGTAMHDNNLVHGTNRPKVTFMGEEYSVL